MKQRLDIARLRRHGLILSACAATALLCACEPLMEDEGDCSAVYQVQFRYTKNILDVDAFAAQVGSVALYVFDSTDGRCVAVQTEAGEALAADGYAMTLDLPAGRRYDLIAWCGLRDGGSFALDDAATPHTKDDITCRLQTAGPADAPTSAAQLDGLWFAADTVTLSPTQVGTRVVRTLYLTKDVNTVRVVLQHYKGRELDADDFEFSIADANAILGPDNLPLPGPTVAYSAWTQRSALVTLPAADDTRAAATRADGTRADADADADTDTDAEITSISSVVAEIDVCRLMASHRPVLTVRRRSDDGDAMQTVLRLPLVDLLLLAKGEAHRPMSDQEYLDRQDDYNLIFFLNDDNGWYMSAGIYVNSWHVMYQQSEL